MCESSTKELLFYVPSCQAVGCPDLTAPSGGWVRREGDSLTVGCGETKHHLVCHGSEWVGTYDNCTHGKSDEENDNGAPS